MTMSSAKWASRHEAMLAARAFSEDQQRLLSVARVVDAGVAGEQQSTAQQFAERIQLKLQANPAALEEKRSVQIIERITAPSVRSKAMRQLER